MEDRLEIRWNHEAVLLAYNHHRELFREASAKVVRDIFGKYVKPSDRIIEIGSGLGELVNLVPEFKEKIQQTEQSPRIAEHNKALNPDSNVKIANVYQLPFSDGEYNVVVGYSVFDTLANLESALTEVKRVLASEGKCVHFLDLQANGQVIFSKYQHSGLIPFPYHDKTVDGVQLIPTEDVQRAMLKMDSVQVDKFQAYCQCPESGFVSLMKRQLLVSFGQDATAIKTDRRTILDFNAFFFDNFKAALGQTGYEIREFGKQQRSIIMQRKGKQNLNPECNLFQNDIGLIQSRYDHILARDLNPNQVKVASTLSVIVAQKKAHQT